MSNRVPSVFCFQILKMDTKNLLISLSMLVTFSCDLEGLP